MCEPDYKIQGEYWVCTKKCYPKQCKTKYYKGEKVAFEWVGGLK